MLMAQKKTKKAPLRRKKPPWSLGGVLCTNHLGHGQMRILIPLLGIIFLCSLLLARHSADARTPKRVPQSQIVSARELEKAKLEKEIRLMTEGHPIEEMAPLIARYDRKVAALLVGIAKKESNWGKRRPVLEGKDCYNYWGFRLKTKKLGSGGHSCFDTPGQAVDTVAKRLKEMVQQEQADTVRKLIVWKCGYRCDGHSSVSVNKWVDDVDYYYQQMLN